MQETDGAADIAHLAVSASILPVAPPPNQDRHRIRPHTREERAYSLLDPPDPITLPLWRLLFLLLPRRFQIIGVREQQQDGLDWLRDVGEKVLVQREQVLKGQGRLGETERVGPLQVMSAPSVGGDDPSSVSVRARIGQPPPLSICSGCSVTFSAAACLDPRDDHHHSARDLLVLRNGLHGWI